MKRHVLKEYMAAARMRRALDDGLERVAAGMPKVCECARCGRRVTVDPAKCLRTGWPACCGETMNLGEIKR